MIRIFIDADGCSVKSEVYKVAARYKLKVFVIANSYLNVPLESNIEMVTVSGSFDAADDWIVDKIEKGDVAITSDILLAERLLKKNARVLGSKGKEFTEDSIGTAVSNRELMANLRHMGENRGGPSAMQPKDRSQFLATLDQIIQALLRS